jgi:hypothetical protein
MTSPNLNNDMLTVKALIEYLDILRVVAGLLGEKLDDLLNTHKFPSIHQIH